MARASKQAEMSRLVPWGLLAVLAVGLDARTAAAQSMVPDPSNLDTGATRSAAPPPTDGDAPPPTPTRLTDSLSIGGETEVVYIREENYDLDNGRKDDLQTIEPDLEVALAYHPNDQVFGYLDVSFLRLYALEEDNRERGKPPRLEVRQAFLDVSDVFEHLSFRFGRQRVRDSREWYVDTELDGLRATYSVGRVQLEGSISRERLFHRDLLHNENNNRINNYFLTGHYDLDDRNRLSAFALLRDDVRSRNARPLFLGLRARGEMVDGLDYWLDLGHVTGRGDFSAGRGRHDSLQGFAADVGITYVLDLPLMPSLTVGYALGSGDSDNGDGTDRGFRQPGFEDNQGRFNGVFPFKYYGEIVDPELSNLSILTVGGGLRYQRLASLDLVYHYYRQQRLAESLRDSDLRVEPNGASKDLGQELDLVVALRNVYGGTAVMTLGYFEPGQAFGARADQAYIMVLRGIYRF